MKRFLAAAVLATLLPVSAMAQLSDAQAQQAELVGQCLVNTAGVEENALLHQLLLSLLDNDAETARSYLPAIAAQARDAAVSRCNQTEDWFNQPWAGAALGNYIQGELISIFTQALDLLQGLQ
jgi:hypothetical protein